MSLPQHELPIITGFLVTTVFHPWVILGGFLRSTSSTLILWSNSVLHIVKTEYQWSIVSLSTPWKCSNCYCGSTVMPKYMYCSVCKSSANNMNTVFWKWKALSVPNSDCGHTAAYTTILCETTLWKLLIDSSNHIYVWKLCRRYLSNTLSNVVVS